MEKKKVALFVLLIVLFQICSTVLVVSLHRYPSATHLDHGFYLDTVESLHRLQDGKNIVSELLDTREDFNPPLHRVTALPFLWVKESKTMAVFSMIPYSIILVLSVYLIGRHYRGDMVGLLAAALTVLMPGVAGFSRTFHTVLPLTALVALSVYFAIKFFEQPTLHGAIWWGGSIALGLLVKWSFAFVVAAPFAYLLVQSVMGGSPNRREWCRTVLIKILLAAGVTIFLVAWWYVPALAHLQDLSRVHWTNYVSTKLDMRAFFSSQPSNDIWCQEVQEECFSPVHDLNDFVQSIGWPMLVSIGFLSILYLWRKRSFDRSSDGRGKGKRVSLNFFLSYALIGATIVYFSSTFIGLRHFVPTLPGFALLAAVLVQDLHLSRSKRKYLALGILSIAVLQFVFLHAIEKPTMGERRIGILRPYTYDAVPIMQDKIYSLFEGGAVSGIAIGTVPINLRSTEVVEAILEGGTGKPTLNVVNLNSCIHLEDSCEEVPDFKALVDGAEMLIWGNENHQLRMEDYCENRAEHCGRWEYRRDECRLLLDAVCNDRRTVTFQYTHYLPESYSIEIISYGGADPPLPVDI